MEGFLLEGLMEEGWQTATPPSAVPPDLKLEGHILSGFFQILHTHQHCDFYLEEGRTELTTPVSTLGPVLQSRHFYPPPPHPQEPVQPRMQLELEDLLTPT